MLGTGGKEPERGRPVSFLMKAILKLQGLVLVPETEEEAAHLGSWRAAQENHVFALAGQGGTGVFLANLGSREEVCREPVAISSTVADPAWRVISNFAPAPFVLDGRRYANVEAFWQGLKFPEAERSHIATLSGPEARRAGQAQGYGTAVVYGGQTMVPGTWDHWLLMERACAAKFTQNAEAACALLATNDRPLEHRMRRDSHTIPGVIMAEIWTKIRARLRRGQLIFTGAAGTAS